MRWAIIVALAMSAALYGSLVMLENEAEHWRAARAASLQCVDEVPDESAR